MDVVFHPVPMLGLLRMGKRGTAENQHGTSGLCMSSIGGGKLSSPFHRGYELLPKNQSSKDSLVIHTVSIYRNISI